MCKIIRIYVSTVLSAPVGYFPASHCLHFNKAFVQHKEDTVLSNGGWKKSPVLLSKQTKQTISLYEWFPITFEHEVNYSEETVADERSASGCQVQRRARFAYQRSAVMSGAMHTPH